MATTNRPVTRLADRTRVPGHDVLVVEAPLEIRLGETPIAVVMRTPGMDAELALGFALTEAIVGRPEHIVDVEKVDDDRLRLVPAPGITIDPEQFRRNTYTTSSCGVCGKASIDAVRITAPPPPPGPSIDPPFLDLMSDRLRASQSVFETTGGLHGAAIFDTGGVILATAEDVGRHNAVDKAIGSLARKRWPFGEVILMVSGRVSFEVVQKALVVGIPFVAGVSAASSLAVDLADELGATLVGFVRPGSAVVYTGSHRISGSHDQSDPDRSPVSDEFDHLGGNL